MIPMLASAHFLSVFTIFDVAIHCEGASQFHGGLMRRMITHDSEEWRQVAYNHPISNLMEKTASEHESLTPHGMNGTEREWVFCSPQGANCRGCPGMMRWGVKGRWKEFKSRTAPFKCDFETLGDPAPGDDGKHCECLAVPGSDFYKSLNIALLSKSLHPSPDVSCKKLEEDKSIGQWGLKQWEAVEAFCSPEWGTSMAASQDFKAGPRAFSAETLAQLMNAWIDPRFRDNYERLYKGGWLDRAFVNYYAEYGSGKHTNMTEQLIRSVHLFSSYPIVVFHFGMVSPKHWNADLFPRLVLLHAAPIPNNKRSFNYNKIRSMLMARVKTGVELDSDEFVAPGIDAIFARTEDEVSEKYQFPIMTAHFLLDKGPKDGGSWWPRFCSDVKKPDCARQTMRWAHAHPTWTYWALPFVGRWLRRLFRDERLPPLIANNHEFASLVVADIPEDEDLLNVALWEDGATKQWCKFDIPDPSNFDYFLRMGEKSLEFVPNKADGTPDFGSLIETENVNSRDPVFHPKGVPEVFYSAHHAVEPDVSSKFIQRIEADRLARRLPPPIVYRGRVFEDGLKLQAVYSGIRCLI